MKSPAEMPGFLFVLAAMSCLQGKVAWCACRTTHHSSARSSSEKITPTYPTAPNPRYSQRVLSGGNASGNLRKSGKDRRFGFTGRNLCGRGGLVQWLRIGQNPQKRRGGWSPGSQASHTRIPKTRVPGTARLSHLSTARRESGRGNGEERCRTIMRGSTGSP